jgi:protein arginine kinase activator
LNCQRCGENEARVGYTEYREGGAEELQICLECAAELGFEIRASSPSEDPAGATKLPPGKVLGIVSLTASITSSGGISSEPKDTRVCESCGLKAEELVKQPLFGCPRCYETFESSLEPLLKRIHGASSHRGRIPGGRVVPADVKDLRRRLQCAISNEDYEEAARVRDELRAAGFESAEDST